MTRYFQVKFDDFGVPTSEEKWTIDKTYRNCKQSSSALEISYQPHKTESTWAQEYVRNHDRWKQNAFRPVSDSHHHLKTPNTSMFHHEVSFLSFKTLPSPALFCVSPRPGAKPTRPFTTICTLRNLSKNHRFFFDFFEWKKIHPPTLCCLDFSGWFHFLPTSTWTISRWKASLVLIQAAHIKNYYW